MVRVEGRKVAPLWIYSYVGVGYCEVEKSGFLARGKAGKKIEVEDKEVEVCEGFCDLGTSCLRKCTCCLRVLGRAMGVEISHDDVVITEVKKKGKVWCEIGGTVIQ